MKKGADINLQDERGNTALMAAVKTGDIDIVKFLLHAKANVNLRTKHGNTALKITRKIGYTKIVELLKKAGAK